MSTAIAQSATQLAISNAKWDESMFLDMARKVSRQTTNGLTREHKMLSWNKLISGVCGIYRDHHCALFEKTDRLPSDIFDMVQDAVSQVISESMGAVTTQNIVAVKRQAVHRYADRKFIERVSVIGENAMTLGEQKLFAGIAVREAKEKLIRLQKKPTPNLDAEAKQSLLISKLETTLAHIVATIESQK